jgi:hypothetical protein
MIAPIADSDFMRVLTQRYSHLAESLLLLVLQTSRENGKPVSSIQADIVREIESWRKGGTSIGVNTEAVLDAALAYLKQHATTPTFFYSRIDPSTIWPLLTNGRKIRWQSSGAEYGLIEAVVIDGAGEINVFSTDTGQAEIYIEQVKEVALTEEEARDRNFGWPLRG